MPAAIDELTFGKGDAGAQPGHTSPDFSPYYGKKPLFVA